MDRGRGRSRGRGRGRGQNFRLDGLSDGMSQMNLDGRGRGRGGRLTRRARGRGRGRARGREIPSHASLTEDMTIQCNHLSGRNSHDPDCTQRRLARRARGRSRGRGGSSPASSTEDLTFQCNHCSGENSHDSDCTQRLVPCPYAYPNYPCDERIKFVNFWPDFESKHGQIEAMENGTTKENVYSLTIFPVKIEAYGKVFITTSMTCEGVYYQWVKLLGSASEAKDFTFTLEYQGSKSTHIFFGEVASIDDAMEEVISSGKCSSIGSILFDIQFYSWSLTIKRPDV